jgi:serine/threonine protein kinase
MLKSTMTGASGLRISPAVRLIRKLGSGGMGSLWVAKHERLNTEVAVKLMAPELARDPSFVQRFAREAAAAARVRSPHVVQVFDHGISSTGLPFIVMELLEGWDLRRHLQRVRVMSPEDVVTMVGQLARALGRAHEIGIVHRDIKPENIFLCDVNDGSLFVKVLDFGIAKSGVLPQGTNTTIGRILGSPYYMSPEQLMGLPVVDQRTDVWSIGAVVFETLTGRRPFYADNLAALAVKIHSEPAPVPSELSPELPPAFDVWFAHACARDREQRFATVRQLSDALPPAFGMPSHRRSDAPPRPISSSPPVPAYGVETLGERRAERRRISCIPASLAGRDSAKLSLIRNISRTGALLYTRIKCEEGDRLELSLHFTEDDPGRPTAAEVVRVEAAESPLWRSEVAVRFLEPLDEFADRINEAIARQSKSGLIR